MCSVSPKSASRLATGGCREITVGISNNNIFLFSFIQGFHNYNDGKTIINISCEIVDILYFLCNSYFIERIAYINIISELFCFFAEDKLGIFESSLKIKHIQKSKVGMQFKKVYTYCSES